MTAAVRQLPAPPRPARGAAAWAALRAAAAAVGARRAQLAVAAAGMVGGASLIGAWCVGLVLMAGSAAAAADAVLVAARDRPGRRPRTTHEDVLDRWRAAQ